MGRKKNKQKKGEFNDTMRQVDKQSMMSALKDENSPPLYPNKGSGKTAD